MTWSEAWGREKKGLHCPIATIAINSDIFSEIKHLAGMMQEACVEAPCDGPEKYCLGQTLAYHASINK